MQVFEKILLAIILHIASFGFMGLLAIQHSHFGEPGYGEQPQDTSFWVNAQQPLHYVYYALSRVYFGVTETLYEYEVEEGTPGDFQVTVPRPPGPINQWSILIYGYDLSGTRVFELEKPAAEVF